VHVNGNLHIRSAQLRLLRTLTWQDSFGAIMHESDMPLQ